MTGPARISFLLPTYRRPQELRRTLEDVWTSVAQPDRLEVILSVTDDDAETIRLLPFTDLPSMAYLIRPHAGYKGLPEAINEVAKFACGDWLFVFADDVGCDTPGWDDVIRRYDHTVPTLLTCANNRGFPVWFPVISRPAYEAIGCVTQSQFHDMWLGAIFDRARPANVHRLIPAHFTDRIVCPHSLAGLTVEERAAYEASIEAAVARLKEAA